VVVGDEAGSASETVLFWRFSFGLIAGGGAAGGEDMVLSSCTDTAAFAGGSGLIFDLH
jgi:hypothetical protein